MNRDKFVEEVNEKGHCLLKKILFEEELSQLKIALNDAIEREVEYHKGKKYSDYGMVLLCSLYGRPLVEVFDNPKLTDPMAWILGPGCIVYAYTSSSMPPNRGNFSSRIHVDCPRISPMPTNLGVMILLDDFTEENGATWYLSGSHNTLEKPKEDFFFENADRLIAEAGSFWFFNPRLWHCGGENLTRCWRHALTINMVLPWMKQRIDIPRAMGAIDTSNYSNMVKQKLGFFAQVPASYDEYYLPPEKRKFRQKVE